MTDDTSDYNLWLSDAKQVDDVSQRLHAAPWKAFEHLPTWDDVTEKYSVVHLSVAYLSAAGSVGLSRPQWRVVNRHRWFYCVNIAGSDKL